MATWSNSRPDLLKSGPARQGAARPVLVCAPGGAAPLVNWPGSTLVESPERLADWPGPVAAVVVAGEPAPAFRAGLLARKNPHLARAPLVAVAVPKGYPAADGCQLWPDLSFSKCPGPERLVSALLDLDDHSRLAGVRGGLRLLVESRSEAVLAATDALKGWLESLPMSRERIAQVYQATMEMALNAMEWGNLNRVEVPVVMAGTAFEDRVEIVVRDQGRGFDPQRLPHAATPEDPLGHIEVREQLGLRDGGFGLVISRGMVDELKHNSIGNQVRLVKRYEVGPKGPGPRGGL